MLWELLAADIERIEGIGAVGAVFEKVFFGLWLLLHRLVFAEAVAPSLHSCRLDSEDQVIVVLAVEVRHQALLSGKTLIDEKVFLIVSHRVAEVHVNELSAERVDENSNLLVGVLVKDEIDVVRIEVPTTDVAFKMEIVFCLCHDCQKLFEGKDILYNNVGERQKNCIFAM